MADCELCNTSLERGETMFQNTLHVVCQKLWHDRHERGECTFCGEKAELKDFIDPCNKCSDGKRQGYDGPQ